MCRWWGRRTAYLLGFILSFGIVALALVIQVQNQLEPCPLCISQRMIFMGLGLLFLIHAFVPAHCWTQRVLLGLEVLTALGGAGVAIRHWWLQAHKQDIIDDCGVGFDYMFENFPLKKALTLVFRGTGDCAAIEWTLLGLTLPQLGLISFLLLAGYALWVFFGRCTQA